MVAKRRHRQVPLIKIEDLDVRHGSKADMCDACLLRAKSGHDLRKQKDRPAGRYGCAFPIS